MTKRYGMGATPTYHDPRIRSLPDGEIFNTITLGKNTMLPYADKLTPRIVGRSSPMSAPSSAPSRARWPTSLTPPPKALGLP
jgi:hypothetical protein